jgi:hypothetical protein
MSNQPVYRRLRSHAYSCRCPRCTPQGGFVDRNGIIGPGFLILCVVAVIGFWPAMVWHGYGGPTGTAWRWDIHSTIAEAVYFGAIGFIVFLCWLGNRPAQRGPRPPRGPLPVEVLRPPPPSVVARPVCLHLNAVKVNSAVPGLDLTYRCWCPACETALPATFRYPCCGGEPGTLPGDGHAYNCPHRKR